MKSLGRVTTDPIPHSLVRDCLSCKRRFSLSVEDFDNNFSMSKVVICSKLSVSLEVRSKIKKKKHWSENVWDENGSNYRIEDLEKGKNILPVCMVSVCRSFQNVH